MRSWFRINMIKTISIRLLQLLEQDNFVPIHTTTKINDTKHYLFKRIRFRTTNEHLPQNINLNNKYNRRNGTDIAIYSNNDKLVNNNINTDLETSKEVLNKQLLQKSDETTEVSVKFQTEIDSVNNLKILSKVDEDERTRLYELRELSDTMIVTENNKLICSSQTISYLKEDVKLITTLKESFAKQIIQQNNDTTALTVNLNTDNELGI